MAFDLKREEEVKEYIENLGIEYRFGCYKEKKPQVCHLLADYFEAIKKDFEKAKKVYKSNCTDFNFGASCFKAGNYCLLGKGGGKPNYEEAFGYYEKGCELNDATSCLHAGMMLTGTGPESNIKRDVPKGFNYLKKSCENNVEMACHYLSGMNITGVPKNFADLNPHDKEKNKNIEYLIRPNMGEAFKYAKKACELGNMYACVNVSVMYRKGEGVAKNEEEAKKFATLAHDIARLDQTTKELKFQQGLEN